MKTYAYVTNEACRVMDAAKPGSFIGREDIPVSRHGDYTTWHMGKRETLAMIGEQRISGYRRRAAAAVAILLEWSRPDY